MAAAPLESTPFRGFPLPTPALARHTLTELGTVYGSRSKGSVDPKASILDSVVKTILSQNTTSTNCNRAFGALKTWMPQWEDVRTAAASDVMDAIRCGGLAAIKTDRIQAMLESIKEDRGKCTLEFLRAAPSVEVKRYLGQFKGVGPKTASCVLLFAMGRDDFAVDTHIFRMAARLGWTPGEALVKRHNKLKLRTPSAQLQAVTQDAGVLALLSAAGGTDTGSTHSSGPPVPGSAAVVAATGSSTPAAPWPRVSRETSYEHLNATLPDETKYALHLLMIEHGRAVCKAQAPLCKQCTLQHVCAYALGKSGGKKRASPTDGESHAPAAAAAVAEKQRRHTAAGPAVPPHAGPSLAGQVVIHTRTATKHDDM